MNNTNTNKIIKKKYKTKNSKDFVESGDAGHSPQKRQQQQQLEEENVRMKKMKIMQKSRNNKNCDINEITNLQKLQSKKENDQQNPEEAIKNIRKNIEPKQNSRKNNKNKEKTETSQQKQILNVNNIENTGTILQNSQQKLNITDIQVIESTTDHRKNKIKENSLKNASITDKNTSLQENENQQPHHDIQYYHHKSYIFMANLKRDYKRLALIYNACIRSEQERQKRNEEEIDKLKKKYQQLQVERTEIKRKRWCRYCESEASYLSSIGNNFYCSPECEEKQNDLVNIMQDLFET